MDDAEKAKQLIKDDILPETKKNSGFMGMEILTCDMEHSVIVQTKWATLDDLKASTAGTEYYKAAVKKTEPYLHLPQVRYYEATEM
eukprot:CAMPEP_0113946298 /NCGR_PEP_ID=MMETSP1339-20121228/56376_1 /TAXON_ID=94617 /ORGANISM="Fibrocapsa japonica" /LENGTH=85 /DNA_ID=CAMNT_0000952313 /DNA_START=61 /DNA_END=318 /DNA_ORIENTATION=- /assembly_acc=CAM_ASM_000762